ncbi:TetR/AcrR family transcriptional regulator [Flavobacterium alkalisoli]|uniref:TetR/AcrR family transcriptional regulator n=1 Tax=Flavobacterium alkalisoli TaxID=2602769 RepID=A0A5B9FVL4_9FLAO|nr:TetR/AcrR family transcriptional regulator [Flavobacterium alkalisoli]QEE51004.1 TetR/AcrR family transcriptional regulator [Flavobacterium alkalisoli]
MPRNKEFDYNEKLRAARDLFWKKGYNATSMSDLVEAMKINRSSLYLTYGNKHDLFLKSLEDYIRDKDMQYRIASELSAEPLQAVRNIIRSVFQSAVKEGNCLFTNSVFELAVVDRQVNSMLTAQSLKTVSLFEKLLTAAKKDGSLKSDKSPRALAHFLVSGLTSIYNVQILFSDTQLTKQTAEILTGVLE